VRGLPGAAICGNAGTVLHTLKANTLRNLLKYFGMLGALAALLVLHSTHWAALQTVAWSRMLVTFAQEGPLLSAVSRTFDGKNPCPMCLKVRDGIAEDQREASAPSAPPDTQRTGEALWEFRVTLTPVPNLSTAEEQPAASVLQTQFRYAPPSPPPRPLLPA